jgi:hypothetical protein
MMNWIPSGDDRREPFRFVTVALVGALLVLALFAPRSAAATTTWEGWRHLTGVVDIGGPRSDGALVVAAQGRLFVLSSSGALTPFARGPRGYSTATGEPYLAVSSEHGTRFGCSFARDEVYAIEQGTPPAIVKVSTTGEAARFASLPAADALAGIAFDTAGHFDGLLLVTASQGGHGALFTVDCRGQVNTLADSAPRMEGGIEVAPESFGRYGGDLIAVDEVSGNVVAIGPDGHAAVIVASGVPSGPDIGVESVGFVPKGLFERGAVFVADRGSQPQPHPGTDTILRLSAETLATAGVHEGELLASSEGGGITIAVTCAATCSARTVASASSVAHIEGHVVAAIDGISAPSKGPSQGGPNVAVIVLAGGAALVGALAIVSLSRRRRSTTHRTSTRHYALPSA